MKLIFYKDARNEYWLTKCEYTKTDVVNQQAELMPDRPAMKQLILPEYIEIDGISYNYGIWRCAFYGSKGRLDAETNVVELVLPASLTTIANDAFKGSHFTNLIFNGVTPPVFNSDAFQGVKDVSASAPIHLYCPKGQYDTYERALRYVAGWSGLEENKKTIALLEMNKSVSDTIIPPLYLAGTSGQTSVWNAQLSRIENTAYLCAKNLDINTEEYEQAMADKAQYTYSADTKLITSSMNGQNGYIYHGIDAVIDSQKTEVDQNVGPLVFSNTEFPENTYLQINSTRIENLGFQNCQNITAIKFEKKPEYIAPNAFRGIDKNRLRTLANGSWTSQRPLSYLVVDIRPSNNQTATPYSILLDSTNKKILLYNNVVFNYPQKPWSQWMPIWSILNSWSDVHDIAPYQCEYDLNMTAIGLTNYKIHNVQYKAFYRCENLSAIYFEGNVNYKQPIYFDDYAFSQCAPDLTLINPPESLSYSALCFDTEPIRKYEYSSAGTNYKMSRWEFTAQTRENQDVFYVYLTKIGIPIPRGNYTLSLIDNAVLENNDLGIDNIIVGTDIDQWTSPNDDNLMWSASDHLTRDGISIENNTDELVYVHIGLINSNSGYNDTNSDIIFDIIDNVSIQIKNNTQQ